MSTHEERVLAEYDAEQRRRAIDAFRSLNATTPEDERISVTLTASEWDLVVAGLEDSARSLGSLDKIIAKIEQATR